MTDCLPEIGQVAPSMWGRRPYAHPGANLGTGNRCGHNPEQFATDRLALPKVKADHGCLPRVLTKNMKRAVEFFSDPNVMKSLGFHQNKHNLDGSNRQVRSENREAVSLVWHAIVSAIDLASLRVGYYLKDGQFKNYSALDLAERCGMVRDGRDPDRPGATKRFPTSRFWRAFKWLKDAGAVSVFEQYEDKGNDELRGRPAIKAVSEKFIRLFGSITGAVMKKARDAAYKRVAVFLARARIFGIQTTDEVDELERGLQVDLMMREVFGSKAKNQKPNRTHKTVRVNIHRDPLDLDVLRTKWEAYAAKITKRIEDKLQRPLRGAENVTLFAKAGGLNFRAWLDSQGLHETS
ncbi:hypothetical protein [Pseudomonas fulva]|uniref:hypothetical protein n=1 Tax=Pseudomonas fulva TaxID=47880 RepID=UPI0018A8F99E|nr:hypothetical protein [Pseudomonas fulva]MBF8694942.1 hypothetical protein [Pseudomonas fulva]